MDKYMQSKMCTDFLLEISELTAKLNTLSENGSLALQKWKRAEKRESSFEEHQFAKERILESCSVIEEIYSNLAFEVLKKLRQAEEFLCDEELDSLKEVAWHDVQQIFLSWDHYQSQKENG